MVARETLHSPDTSKLEIDAVNELIRLNFGVHTPEFEWTGAGTLTGTFPPPRYSYVSLNDVDFSTNVQDSMQATATSRRGETWCFDFPYWKNIEAVNPIDADIFAPRIYAAFALAGVSYKGRLWRDLSCAELAQKCHDMAGGAVGKAVRYVCPVTCGCPDPRRGIYNNLPPEGCPIQCAGNPAGRASFFETNLNSTNASLGSGPTSSWSDLVYWNSVYQAQYFHNCSDAEPSALRFYATNWANHFRRLWGKFVPAGSAIDTSIDNVVQSLQTNGCEFLNIPYDVSFGFLHDGFYGPNRTELISGQPWCQRTHDRASLSPLCPVACHCRQYFGALNSSAPHPFSWGGPQDCPASCQVPT